MIPTPTPIPAANQALISINPSEFRLWAFAPEIVNYWNYANREFSAGLVIQVTIILIMIVAVIPLVMRWARWVERDDYDR